MATRSRAGLAPIPSSCPWVWSGERKSERGRERSSAPVGFFGSRKICGARVRDDLDVHLI